MGMAEYCGTELQCSGCGERFVSERCLSREEVVVRECPDCKTTTLIIIRQDVAV